MSGSLQLPPTPGTNSRQVGPPFGRDSARVSGVAVARVRRTAVTRPYVTAGLSDAPPSGFSPTDKYVRQFLIPLLGPGAVADLLRLTAAAHSGRPIRLPLHLATLLREGLAARTQDNGILVPPIVQPLARHQVRRLPPALRRTHRYATAAVDVKPAS